MKINISSQIQFWFTPVTQPELPNDFTSMRSLISILLLYFLLNVINNNIKKYKITALARITHLFLHMRFSYVAKLIFPF